MKSISFFSRLAFAGPIVAFAAFATPLAAQSPSASPPESSAPAPSWPEANARVDRLGGWRNYSREAPALVTVPECAPIADAKAPVLDAAEAIARALAPHPWPPYAWRDAQGTTRRVHVDGDLVARASVVRQAWLHAVAAQARLAGAARLYASFDAAADLAQRLHKVGNLAAYDLAHERLALAKARIACQEAQQEARATVAKLQQAINLDFATSPTWRLPDTLPTLPATLPDSPTLHERARRALSNTDTPRVQAQLQQSEVRWRNTHARALLWQNSVLPQAKIIAEESVLRYNGMLIGPGELLADAREELDVEHGTLAALETFWLADVALEAALMGHHLAEE